MVGRNLDDADPGAPEPSDGPSERPGTASGTPEPTEIIGAAIGKDDIQVHDDPGGARQEREDPGGARQGSEDPGGARQEREDPGGARQESEDPGGARQEREDPGGAGQESEESTAAWAASVTAAAAQEPTDSARARHQPRDPGRAPHQSDEKYAATAASIAVGPAAEPRPALQPRHAEPSWSRVIATTARLWVRRHLRRTTRHGSAGATRVRAGERETAGRRHLLLGLIAGAIAIVVAAGLIVAYAAIKPAPSRIPQSSARGTAGSTAIANVRTRTAAWVTGQVSPGAIVACDPVMCAALQARGLAVQNLLVLQASTSDPLGSDVVVATAAVRSEFGSRLASVYAPLVIASFGRGSARIDVRAVAPDGTAAYLAALRSDLSAREDAGNQLTHNTSISMPTAAARELADGQVDARLLITLAALAARQPVRLIAFSGSAPGESPGVPLRAAKIAGTGASGAADLRSDLKFVQAQLPPYRPLLARVVRTGDRAVLNIEYGAPSPLGLLGARVTP